MGVKSPPPGRWSFTSALIRELRSVATCEAGVTVSELHQRLCRKEAGLRQTPFHVDLAVGTRKSIRLRALGARENGADMPVAEGTQLTLQVTLREVINKTAIPLIVQWLKHEAPPIVSRMEVEKIISKTRKVQDFIFEQEPSDRAAFSIQSLNGPAKREVFEAWTAFATLVAKAEMILPVDHGGSESSLGISNREDVDFVKELGMRLSKLMETIKAVVMSAEELYDKDRLREITENASSDDIGLSTLLKMRLMALSPSIDTNMDEDSSADKDIKPADRPQTLTPMDHPELGPVLVEYKGSCSGDDAIVRQSNQRVRQLADLLSVSKPEEFRALNCLKSFQLSDHSKYCLAFAIPAGCLGVPTSLRDIISKTKGVERPTLGERFGIAFKIAQSIANWHRVGWLHQSVASNNVMFFAPLQGSSRLDFSSPYLCGFEYARPNASPSFPRYVENFDVAVYCHPERQGLPSNHHRKRHDLYSLGVVLLEIGLWRPVKELFPTSKYTRVTPVEMKETLLKNATARLAHYMGSGYARAVITCLSGNFHVKLDDEMESQLSSAFHRLVVTTLFQGVGLD